MNTNNKLPMVAKIIACIFLYGVIIWMPQGFYDCMVYPNKALKALKKVHSKVMIAEIRPGWSVGCIGI